VLPHQCAFIWSGDTSLNTTVAAVFGSFTTVTCVVPALFSSAALNGLSSAVMFLEVSRTVSAGGSRIWTRDRRQFRYVLTPTLASLSVRRVVDLSSLNAGALRSVELDITTVSTPIPATSIAPLLPADFAVWCHVNNSLTGITPAPTVAVRLSSNEVRCTVSAPPPGTSASDVFTVMLSFDGLFYSNGMPFTYPFLTLQPTLSSITPAVVMAGVGSAVSPLNSAVGSAGWPYYGYGDFRVMGAQFGLATVYTCVFTSADAVLRSTATVVNSTQVTCPSPVLREGLWALRLLDPYSTPSLSSLTIQVLPRATVRSVEPQWAPATGGSTVTLTGFDFVTDAVFAGASSATYCDIRVGSAVSSVLASTISPDTITCILPASPVALSAYTGAAAVIGSASTHAEGVITVRLSLSASSDATAPLLPYTAGALNAVRLVYYSTETITSVSVLTMQQALVYGLAGLHTATPPQLAVLVSGTGLLTSGHLRCRFSSTVTRSSWISSDLPVNAYVLNSSTVLCLAPASVAGIGGVFGVWISNNGVDFAPSGDGISATAPVTVAPFVVTAGGVSSKRVR